MLGAEYDLLCELAHPRIVAVLGVMLGDQFMSSADYDALPSCPSPSAFVLEYVSGGTLASTIRLHPERCTVEAATRWTTELAEALVFLQAHCVIHFDIKSENILVRLRCFHKLVV